MIRRHGSKPTLALWMLVALADVALLVAAAGVLAVLVAVFGAVILTGGFVALRALQRRPAEQPGSALRRRA
jgi:uncharacterized membrane protein YedE/YeeE